MLRDDFFTRHLCANSTPKEKTYTICRCIGCHRETWTGIPRRACFLFFGTGGTTKKLFMFCTCVKDSAMSSVKNTNTKILADLTSPNLPQQNTHATVCNVTMPSSTRSRLQLEIEVCGIIWKCLQVQSFPSSDHFLSTWTRPGTAKPRGAWRITAQKFCPELISVPSCSKPMLSM